MPAASQARAMTACVRNLRGKVTSIDGAGHEIRTSGSMIPSGRFRKKVLEKEERPRTKKQANAP
jgi:hypothetical protein